MSLPLLPIWDNVTLLKCKLYQQIGPAHISTHKQYLAWNSISMTKSTWSYDTYLVCPETKSSMKREYRESLLCSSEVSRDRSTGPSLKDREGDEYWVPSRRVAFAIAVDRLPSEAENLG